MKKENDIQAELREWGSPLADMSRAMPFKVPVGYFEANIEEVSFYTAGEPTIAGIKDIPFSMPDGFFEAFPQQMLDIAKAESFGTSTPQETPYALPAGYFEALPGAILAHVNTKPAGRTITFTPRTWMRQAVAAVILIAVGIGGYEYEIHRHISPEKQLARVSEKSVQEYVHQNLNDVDAEATTTPVNDVAVVNATRQLDKTDIEQYLDETGLKTEYNIN